MSRKNKKNKGPLAQQMQQKTHLLSWLKEHPEFETVMESRLTHLLKDSLEELYNSESSTITGSVRWNNYECWFDAVLRHEHLQVNVKRKLSWPLIQPYENARYQALIEKLCQDLCDSFRDSAPDKSKQLIHSQIMKACWNELKAMIKRKDPVFQGLKATITRSNKNNGYACGIQRDQLNLFSVDRVRLLETAAPFGSLGLYSISDQTWFPELDRMVIQNPVFGFFAIDHKIEKEVINPAKIRSAISAHLNDQIQDALFRPVVLTQSLSVDLHNNLSLTDRTTLNSVFPQIVLSEMEKWRAFAEDILKQWTLTPEIYRPPAKTLEECQIVYNPQNPGIVQIQSSIASATLYLNDPEQNEFQMDESIQKEWKKREKPIFKQAYAQAENLLACARQAGCQLSRKSGSGLMSGKGKFVLRQGRQEAEVILSGPSYSKNYEEWLTNISSLLENSQATLTSLITDKQNSQFVDAMEKLDNLIQLDILECFSIHPKIPFDFLVKCLTDPSAFPSFERFPKKKRGLYQDVLSEDRIRMEVRKMDARNLVRIRSVTSYNGGWGGSEYDAVFLLAAGRDLCAALQKPVSIDQEALLQKVQSQAPLHELETLYFLPAFVKRLKTHQQIQPGEWAAALASVSSVGLLSRIPEAITSMAEFIPDVLKPAFRARAELLRLQAGKLQ
ncbi:hypothetical protein AAK899_03340 [Erysipelotrichaceae bacterium 51-3]